MHEKIYVTLSALFCCLILIGNITYRKFVIIEVPYLYSFEISVGAILYPLTFLVTDIITEFYKKDKATFTVRLGILLNIVTALIIISMDNIKATDWSVINDDIFHKVFGFFGYSFLGSMIATFISQTIDIYIYLLIRSATKGRFLGLRNVVSTSVSLLIDTVIVIVFLAYVGVLPKEQVTTLIYNSYLWKLSFTIALVPVFYLCVKIIKHILSYS
ncbi:MAG: queuosine precursor transporter [Rickettsiaceae bacterium]|nr:queuosine precursor transporter [Rickettsiaceae bacterium]